MTCIPSFSRTKISKGVFERTCVFMVSSPVSQSQSMEEFGSTPKSDFKVENLKP